MDFEKATFICGHRKSGTTLMLTLLDNHPELLTYPPDSAFFYGYYPNFAEGDHTAEEKIERMAGFIADQLIDTELNNLTAQDKQDLAFPGEAFREDIRRYAREGDKSPRDMLISLFKAYRDNFNGSQNAKRWVEKTTSTEIYAAEVKSWFPEAKFIHVIRDPRDNWASLKSGWLKRYQQFNDELYRLMQSMIDRGKLGYEYAKNNLKRFGEDDYLIVRYEDLTTSSMDTLNKISDFLGVTFSEEMLQPTVCGKLWRGNNFEGLTFEKPSSVNVGRWPERITEEEAQLIEYYFGELMDHFGYSLAYSLPEQMDAATTHYKWYNFAQKFSQATREE